MAKSLIKSIITDLSLSISAKGHATLLSSGGNSPIKILNLLSMSNSLDWSCINASLIDDRMVHKNHKDSNEKILIENLAVNSAKDVNIISLRKNPEKISKLKRPFDIVLMGFGYDGHFASLFPTHIKEKNLFSLNAKPDIFLLKKQGIPKHRRITMNLSMILKSKRIILISSNKEKNKVIKQAKTDKQMPLYFLLNQKKIKIEILSGTKLC